MKSGKKYLEAVQKYDKHVQYPVEEAVKIVKDVAFAKFDETVELSIKLKLKKKPGSKRYSCASQPVCSSKKSSCFCKR